MTDKLAIWECPNCKAINYEYYPLPMFPICDNCIIPFDFDRTDMENCTLVIMSDDEEMHNESHIRF